MRTFRHGLALAAALAVGSFVSSAQNAISAKAGLISVADGEVFAADKEVQPKPNEMVAVKQGEILRTAEGRTEVLLAPGTFLRMPDASSFRLVSNKLEDVRIEVLSGTVLIEVVELLQENAITLQVKDAVAQLRKPGIYRFDYDQSSIRVYEGEASVQAGGQSYVLKGERELVSTDGAWKTAKFDDRFTDALFRWSKRRSEHIAIANLSAARTYTGSRWGAGQSGWAYNPYLGTFTFIPMMDTMRSPFGWAFFTPWTVMNMYMPRTYYGGGYYPGYSSGGVSAPSRGPSFGTGSYGSGASLPPRGAGPSSSGGASAPAAPPAGNPRMGDTGGMRSPGGSGRRQ
jgi:hypothetical protein